MARRKSPDYDVPAEAISYEVQVEELISKADDLPEGPAKVAIFEEAVALADMHQDVELAYDTRMEMLWPAYHASRQDLLLVHFAWCLSKLDSDPDLDAHEALWAYRWVLDSMPGFPDIPRSQIEAAVGDMERRYTKHGASLRPCYLLQRRVFLGLGDRAAAQASHRKIAKTKRDWLSDDFETEKAFAIFYATLCEKYAQAVKLGEKFLAERYITTHFRGLILTELILPLARLGRWDEAAECQRQSLPMLKQERQTAGNFAYHTQYLVIVQNFAQAVKVFEGHFGAAATKQNRITRYDYYKAGKFLCERLREVGKPQTKIRVPDSAQVPGAVGGRLRSDLLLPWLDEQLADLVQRFDTRNGTTYYAEELAKLSELHELAEAFPAENVVKKPRAPRRKAE